MLVLRLAALPMATLLPLGAAPRAHAGDELDPRGFSLVGRVAPSGRGAAEPLAVGAATGYGYTGAVLGAGDTHHRVAGSLAGEFSPRRWLGLGLRLDGRFDSHTLPGTSADSGWVGDPRIFVRGDRMLGDATSAGVRVVGWFPGDQAPSIKLSAATVDLLATLTHAASDSFVLTANAGYRIDNSAASAPNAQRLMPGDRIALGVSAFNAALMGASATFGGPRYNVFAEWSWDLLVGARAPSAMTSPMRIGVGGRARLNSILAFEGTAELSPSSRPSPAMDAPLIPVPPRFMALAGLVARWGAAVPVARPAPVDQPPKIEPVAVTVKEPKPAATAAMVARIESGGALPPDTKLIIKSTQGEREVTPDASGRVALEDLPPGAATVTATAEGYEPATAEITFAANEPVQLSLALKPKLPPGQIRGTIRSFGGRGLTAQISVKLVKGVEDDKGDKDGKGDKGGKVPSDVPPHELRADGGLFQIDVQPGNYEVTIKAPDYEPQTRSVRVEQNGVTVLNVDLRKGR